MGLVGLYMGKVYRVRKKLLGSAVFQQFVRPLVVSEPACAENRLTIEDVCQLSWLSVSLSVRTNEILINYIASVTPTCAVNSMHGFPR